MRMATCLYIKIHRLCVCACDDESSLAVPDSRHANLDEFHLHEEIKILIVENSSSSYMLGYVHTSSGACHHTSLDTCSHLDSRQTKYFIGLIATCTLSSLVRSGPNFIPSVRSGPIGPVRKVYTTVVL